MDAAKGTSPSRLDRAFSPKALGPQLAARTWGLSWRTGFVIVAPSFPIGRQSLNRFWMPRRRSRGAIGTRAQHSYLQPRLGRLGALLLMRAQACEARTEREEKWPNRSLNGRSRIATWGRSATLTTARRR